MLGYLEVSDDPSGYLKVHYAPQSLFYTISPDVILSADDVKYAAQLVADSIAKAYLDDIYSQLIAYPKLVSLAKKKVTGSSVKSNVLPNFANWTTSVTVSKSAGGSSKSISAKPAQSKNAHGVLAALHKAVPGLVGAKATCPACAAGTSTTPLDDVIVHLNDTHQWPRERIADWLETLDVDLSFKEPSSAPEQQHEEMQGQLAPPAIVDEIHDVNFGLSLWKKLNSWFIHTLSKPTLEDLGGGTA